MIQIKNEKLGYILIIITVLLALVWLMITPPIEQNTVYHNFKDSRALLGVPNFWNVISNIPFLVVGILALYKILVSKKLMIQSEFKVAYLFLFSGLSLVALGSGYYHLQPDNNSLVWDRLPMTVAFMALFSIFICEYISLAFAKVFFKPAIVAGILSVAYWHLTESSGAGDLRYYYLIQFLPMLIAPIIMIFFSSCFSKSQAYWWLLFFYIIAKLFEVYDEELYSVLGFVSGHTLKHLAAALGFYILLLAYERRSLIKQS